METKSSINIYEFLKYRNILDIFIDKFTESCLTSMRYESSEISKAIIIVLKEYGINFIDNWEYAKKGMTIGIPTKNIFLNIKILYETNLNLRKIELEKVLLHELVHCVQLELGYNFISYIDYWIDEEKYKSQYVEYEADYISDRFHTIVSDIVEILQDPYICKMITVTDKE